MRGTRVLIADSQPIFRAGVRDLLVREQDFAVVEAGTLDSVMKAVRRTCPDIALIDLKLPPLGGVAAVARLAEQCPTHMIVWGFEANPETVLAAIRAGASGFLHKEISATGLVRSLHGVVRGEAPLARDLATLMIHALRGVEQRDRVRDKAAVLSSRERQVLSYVAQGARNRQIAQALYISEFTVKRHMQNILQKLALPSRRAAGDFYRSAFEAEEPTVSVGETA